MFKKMSLLVLVLGLAGVAQALDTVADFTFDDANSLDAFTQTGMPTVADGQLQLDGSSYLEIADPLAGAIDNYVVEAIVAASSFDAFDFAFARNDPNGSKGGNNGQGLLLQDFGAGPGQIKVLNSFCCATGGFSSDPNTSVVLALDTPTALAAVQNGGVTQLYVNGVMVNETTDGGIKGVPTNLGIGTHPFDGVLGAFNGSIDRVRLSTFDPNDPNTFSADDLLIPFTTVADFTFDDANALAAFVPTGTPSVVDGQLQLDGSSYLEIADPLAGATDNYVVEAILTAVAFDAFDFAFARNDPNGSKGGNNGQGLLFQNFGAGDGQIGVLNSFCCATHGFAADANSVVLTLDTPTALAAVQNGGVTELYINGVKVDETTDGGIKGVPTNLGIGTHPFDSVAGAFNGSIDRVRLSIFGPGGFAATELLTLPVDPVPVD